MPIAIFPSGHDHRSAQAGARGVRGAARGGVAGRGADDRLGARPLRARDRDRHPPVLEAPGWVRALELQVDLGADALGEPRGVDQRRRALVQRDDRVALLDREVVAVALDQRRRHDG